MKTTFYLIRNRIIVILHDFLAIALAWWCAYWLRFNLGVIPPAVFSQMYAVLPMLLVTQAACYWAFGLYRGIWRFASLQDLVRIIKAVGLGMALTLLALFLDKRLVDIPRSVFPLYALLLVTFLGGSRFLCRWLKDHGPKLGQRVLIVGAGQAGEGVVRDMLRHAKKDYYAVAFVDDRKPKKGHEIHGVRVVGLIADIPRIVAEYRIDLIIIAIPSARSAEMRRIVNLCEMTHIPFRTLPGLNDLASGMVKIDALRQVSVEDLLGRDPVSLDWHRIESGICEKTVLVSGGGGSIGSELCRQIAQLNPKKLVVIEQNEFNLYNLKLEMSQKFPTVEFIGYLADVTDRVAVRRIVRLHTFDVVFHAAAYKHVPMLEHQIRVAVKNNILGTQILAEETVNADIRKFVLISTDKAVNPTNIMGATKRVAEIFIQNYNNHSNTEFITVRFGNVLGSAGSVVPLFRKQIEEGGPLTVTHPEITRFFMTIPEASQLILQATVMGQGREIFVLDMGESVKISYLAEQMILLAGLVPNQDIDIVYTGLRPGEKLYEELFYGSECLVPTAHGKILQAAYRECHWESLLSALDGLSQAVEQNGEALLYDLLMQLVPEFKQTVSLPSESGAVHIESVKLENHVSI